MVFREDDLFINAFKYASIGMALVSPEGKFLKVNNSLCELLGYDEESLTELDFQRITHPDDLKIDLDRVDEVIQGKCDSYQLEKRYITKSGKIVWAILSVSLIREESGGPRFFISQIQDITELKAIQEELSVKSKFHSFGQLSVKLTHEINNPLAIILLNSTGLKTLDLNTEEGKNALNIFTENILTAVKRVSDTMKKFSEITSSQKTKELEDFLKLKKSG